MEITEKKELVKKYILAELKESWLTSKRKCIRCSALVKASNNGTTILVNNIKSGEKK